MLHKLYIPAIASMAVLAAPPISAQTVFLSQLPDANGFAWYSGAMVPDPDREAGSFTLTSSETLSAVNWWGFSTATGSGTGPFTAQLYADTGSGGPAASPLVTLSLAAPTITAMGTLSDGGEIFKYSANLTSDYSLASGTPYYLSVFDSSTTEPWYWQTANRTGNNWYEAPPGSAWVLGDDDGQPTGALAFQLISPAAAIPEPAALTLIASGLSAAGLIARGRRRA